MTAMRLQMFLLSQEGRVASVVVIVPCLRMVQCRGFWIITVEDGAMYRSGTDVNDSNKNVGRKWKTVTIFRLVPPRYVSYSNRGKLSRYFYFFAHVSMLALQIL
jgi:hypothetical protein